MTTQNRQKSYAKINKWLLFFLQINDEDMEKSAETHTHNPPRSKEALYYRRIFEKSYAGMDFWIPYYWMPKWTETSDPSARTLKHYKQ